VNGQIIKVIKKGLRHNDYPNVQGGEYETIKRRGSQAYEKNNEGLDAGGDVVERGGVGRRVEARICRTAGCGADVDLVVLAG